MARLNHASLRAQLHDCRAQFEAIKQHGEASADTLALINALFMLVDIVVAVFLERTTPKTSRNSGLPSSRDGTDDGQTHTEGKSGSRSRGPKARHARSDNLRTVTTTHTSAVTGCRQCGHDLTGTACTAHEQRVEIDIVFETVERQVTAEIKTCPRCHTRTKGSFPATMPGPVQYGPGIVAYVVHLLCAQMVSLKRTAAMIQAMTGRLLSEATLLGFVSRLHQALEPWEGAAIGKLLDMPVSVLTVTDGRAIGLFDGIESLTEVMPDRVPHGRHRVRAHRCGRSGEAWRCTPRRAAMAVSKLTAPWRSLDEVRRWRPGA